MNKQNAPFVGVYVNTDNIGPEKTLDVCREADALGYNALVAWGFEHCGPQLDEAYASRTRKLTFALDDLGWSVYVQTANIGPRVAAALGSKALETAARDDDRTICLADPRILPLWSHWMRRLDTYWPKVDGVLIPYDEMRAQGTHPGCAAIGKRDGGFGRLLAIHAHDAIHAHRLIDPGVQIAVWNDMFDPTKGGNAKPGDYVGDYPDRKWRVKGGYHGSTGGIGKDVLVFNWTTNADDEWKPSFDFWKQRGNRQIYCGFYDYGSSDYGDGQPADVEKARLAGGGYSGYLYTTWKGNYDRLRLKEYFPGPEAIAAMKPLPRRGH